MAVALLIGVSALAGGCAGVVGNRLYRPDPMPAGPPAWTGSAPQPVTAISADGVRLAGLYWPPRRAEGPLFIFYHGNGGNLYSAAEMAQPLAADGAGLLVADYRGYSGNPGKPSEKGLMADGEAFLAKARELAPRAQLIPFGFSLGSAVALEMAARHEVRAVITLGAFSKLTAMMPPGAALLTSDRYDNMAAVRRVAEPILMIHGTADEVVPIGEFEKLRRAGGHIRYWRLNGAPHHIDFRWLAPKLGEQLGELPAEPVAAR